MRRGVLLATAVAALGSAVVLGPRRGAGPGLAESLGGLRILLQDALFLRAEALRREGRYDDVPALYRQVLDLDPDNEDALDFLATTEARDLRTSAPTPEGRVRWWKDGLDLLERGLERRPDSARLHFRAADLWLLVPEQDAAVAAHAAATGRDRWAEGLSHLRRAMRAAPWIPRLGFVHLDAIAVLAPAYAAEALAEGRPGVDDWLRLGRDTLLLRGDVLATIGLEVERPDVHADTLLRRGIEVVEQVRRGLAESPADRERAREGLALYVQAFGRNRVARALERRLR